MQEGEHRELMIAAIGIAPLWAWVRSRQWKTAGSWLAGAALCMVLMAGMDLPEDLVLALEKPIGSDTETARELNRLVGRLVPEERTFRVDHFLGMPAVLNFVGLRFANRLLEPLMSREHVESVEIVFDETLFIPPVGSGQGAIRQPIPLSTAGTAVLTIDNPVAPRMVARRTGHSAAAALRTQWRAGDRAREHSHPGRGRPGPGPRRPP